MKVTLPPAKRTKEKRSRRLPPALSLEPGPEDIDDRETVTGRPHPPSAHQFLSPVPYSARRELLAAQQGPSRELTSGSSATYRESSAGRSLCGISGARQTNEVSPRHHSPAPFHYDDVDRGRETRMRGESGAAEGQLDDGRRGRGEGRHGRVDRDGDEQYGKLDDEDRGRSQGGHSPRASSKRPRSYDEYDYEHPRANIPPRSAR